MIYPPLILTETEKELVEQQLNKLDEQIDAQLSRREDDLRLEEEVIKFSCNGCEMRDVLK